MYSAILIVVFLASAMAFAPFMCTNRKFTSKIDGKRPHPPLHSLARLVHCPLEQRPALSIELRAFAFLQWAYTVYLHSTSVCNESLCFCIIADIHQLYLSVYTSMVAPKTDLAMSTYWEGEAPPSSVLGK
jgi:hypothetical protein